MGLQIIIHVYLLAALCTYSSSAASVSENLMLSVESPVLVHLGHTTILPCWLSQAQNAEGLEVRWYRQDYDKPIILYREKKLELSQEALYAGRVSFGLKEAASGGLTRGDVSLKLENATIADAGDYSCYVSSEKGYDSERVSVSVVETGTSPLLSAEWKGDLVNMTCTSEGWHPQPSLRWSQQEQDLTPKGLKYIESPYGLVSVHSWILVSSPSEISCSVGLSDGGMKEARVHLGISSQPAKQESGSGSVAGWVAFALLLIAMLALLGVLFKKRGLLFGKSDTSERNQAEEIMKLLPQVTPTAFAEANNCYVNIKLEETRHPFLTIKDGKLRDKYDVKFPDGQNVTCLTATKGTPGFSSGQHYWEVSLGKAQLGLKESWWVGVTNADGFPLDHNVPPTASNGFWFLSSSPDQADIFQFSTEPKVSLPVRSRPRTVGVYLNYDSGELSFYNVEDECIIGSLTTTFSGEVFPLFNPGKGDKLPMEIIQRAAQGDCNETDNCVPTVQQSEA